MILVVLISLPLKTVVVAAEIRIIATWFIVC